MGKVQVFRDRSTEEINEDLRTLQKEIYELRGKKIATKGDKTHLIRQKRKDIARILTIKREREIQENIQRS